MMKPDDHDAFAFWFSHDFMVSTGGGGDTHIRCNKIGGEESQESSEGERGES